MHASAPTNNDELAALARHVLEDGIECPQIAQALRNGCDPLGDAFLHINSAADRRKTGSVYTPASVVSFMVDTAAQAISPQRIVDCGCGSGRFAIACAHRFPQADIVAVDTSPLAALICRANVHAAGLDDRVTVLSDDFLTAELPGQGKPTLWIGNPPYVRHHDISPSTKEWLERTATSLAIPSNKLAGLHIYFLLAIATRWGKDDYGMLVTSSEWLDTKYGKVARDLLTSRLQLEFIRLHDRHDEIFAGTQSTAVVIGFGSPSFQKAQVVSVWDRNGTQHLNAQLLPSTERWTSLLRSTDSPSRDQSSLPLRHFVPLGSLMEVHRGVATGNNRFWVRPSDKLGDIPSHLTVPVVAHAREIMGENIAQSAPDELNRLIILPPSLEELDGKDAIAVGALIHEAESLGIDQGYIARHRSPWWSIRPPRIPEIMMTYMGRSTPTFVLNDHKLPMLNVIHGLYPKRDFSPRALQNLTNYLNEHVQLSDGRMYSGGLVKYEPKEVSAIMVPPYEELDR